MVSASLDALELHLNVFTSCCELPGVGTDNRSSPSATAQNALPSHLSTPPPAHPLAAANVASDSLPSDSPAFSVGPDEEDVLLAGHRSPV